ncbi:MAG: hypothetical protein R3F61_14245 [Myxococcota bacterium]
MSRWWWVGGAAVVGVIAAVLALGPGSDTTPEAPGPVERVPSEQEQARSQVPAPPAVPRSRPVNEPTVTQFAQEQGLDAETSEAVSMAVRGHRERVGRIEAELVANDAAPPEELAALRDQLGESFAQLRSDVADALPPDALDAFMDSVGDALEPSRTPPGVER